MGNQIAELINNRKRRSEIKKKGERKKKTIKNANGAVQKSDKAKTHAHTHIHQIKRASTAHAPIRLYFIH